MAKDGSAPQGVKIHVRLRRKGKVVRRRTRTTRVNAFQLTFRVKRAGRYRAVVTAKVEGKTLRARTKRLRVK